MSLQPLNVSVGLRLKTGTHCGTRDLEPRIWDSRIAGRVIYVEITLETKGL